ncbi:hypothetical protein [Candidatus Nitrosotalea okcheonensis]|uniref:Uncharacterized protein n=1 Tax=Candidatus Nitrosotalea okcheonensis TaxID=1903276 RepID=A0A2H1FH63_9ARCH|nr:hypothetical protein [Candidatus Nitrosotalea okcheonensis]SMH72022.1 protein of unknown function [Candidatus Nitrosotalea okcheonensis]
MVSEEDIQRITSLSLLELKNKGWLKEDPHDEVYSQILERNELTRILVNKLSDVIHPAKFSEFKSDMSKHGFTENDIIHNYFLILCQITLAKYETLKRFLLSILNKEKQFEYTTRNNQTRTWQICKEDTFGKLIDKLTQILVTPDFESIFNNDLRNALAHDGWWVKDNKFCFRKNSTLISYGFSEFMKEGKIVDLTIGYFTVNYMNNHRSR